MSYFAKSIGSGSSLAPISVDRLAQVLQDEGMSFGYSENQSRLGGCWGDHLVELVFYGETSDVLQVQAHWGRPLSAGRWTDVVERVNSSNSERIWPKLHVERDGDSLTVTAEHAVDYGPGASDEQLVQHVRRTIAASLGAFRKLDEVYPQAVAAWRAEHLGWSDE